MDLFYHHSHLSGRLGHCAWGGFWDAEPLRPMRQAQVFSFAYFDMPLYILIYVIVIPP